MNVTWIRCKYWLDCCVSVCDNILSECAFDCFVCVCAKERQTDYTPFNTPNEGTLTHARTDTNPCCSLQFRFFVCWIVCLPKPLHSNSLEVIVFGSWTLVNVRVWEREITQCLTRVQITLSVKSFELYFINATNVWYCWLDVYAFWIQKCLCTIWTMGDVSAQIGASAFKVTLVVCV